MENEVVRGEKKYLCHTVLMWGFFFCLNLALQVVKCKSENGVKCVERKENEHLVVKRFH